MTDPRIHTRGTHLVYVLPPQPQTLATDFPLKGDGQIIGLSDSGALLSSIPMPHAHYVFMLV